jgi:hypothetical protein
MEDEKLPRCDCQEHLAQELILLQPKGKTFRNHNAVTEHLRSAREAAGAPQEAKPNMPLASWLQVRGGKELSLVQQVNKPRTQATRKPQSLTSASQSSEASNSLAGFNETMNSLVEELKARRIPFCHSTLLWAVPGISLKWLLLFKTNLL